MMIERRFVEMGTTEVAPELIAEFREYSVPELTEFSAKEPGYEEWSKGQREWIEFQVAESGGTLGLVKEELGPIDILFLVLGIATAFGMVSKAD